MTDPQFWEWYWKVLISSVTMGLFVAYVIGLFIADYQIQKHYEKKSPEL